MKKRLISLYLLALGMMLSVQACASEYTDPNDIVVDEVETPVAFADPFIMLHNGVYYAYGTNAENGIEVYTSDDLLTWKYKSMALDKKDSWGDRWFWAPEVYAVNGKFYMYYTANEHICAAIADSPAGPFVQSKQEPMIAEEKCIDNSLFIDDDGTPYLFFDRFNDGLNIWVAELEKDLVAIKKETMHPCIHVSQAWEEVWPRVNEGPYVLKRNGIYYMTYSANSYESPFYGIGCATATDLMGTWTKYGENPLLQNPGDLVGVGHNAMFTDKEGKLRLVFHAHKDKSNIHPRAMYIGNVSFEKVDGAERMRISKEYMTPKLVE